MKIISSILSKIIKKLSSNKSSNNNYYIELKDSNKKKEVKK